MQPWPDLRPILKGLRWLVVGGVATRAYMPERATQDLDILVYHSDIDEALQLLQNANYKLISPLAIAGYNLRSPEGIDLDILVSTETWFEEAWQNQRHDSAGYPILPLPYLVLMKLQSSRTQDMSDISRMLGLAPEKEIKEVKEVINRYSPQDIEDIESLIYLGKLEFN